ncbi:MAG: AraC family transcriptional regulator [Phycisphaeraceae bacterium]
MAKRIQNTTAAVVRAASGGDGRLGTLTHAGVLRKREPGTIFNPMRVFGQYALVYLMEGQGRYLDANGVDRALGAGDVIVVFPELAHRYGPQPGQLWSEAFVVFTGPVFELWRSLGLLDPLQPVLHAQPVDHWRRRIQWVLEAGRPGGQAAAVEEVNRLQLLLAELWAHQQPADRGAASAWVRRACLLLEDHLHGPPDLPAVARQLGVSYASFRRRFAMAMGVSPGRYYAQRQIDRACELMQMGEMSDKQIAAELGFCDPFHLSRRFKQFTGLSPRAYRRSLP